MDEVGGELKFCLPRLMARLLVVSRLLRPAQEPRHVKRRWGSWQGGDACLFNRNTLLDETSVIITAAAAVGSRVGLLIHWLK